MNGLKRHVGKLEQIVRLMDNDLLDPDKIDEVRARLSLVSSCACVGLVPHTPAHGPATD